MTKFTLHLQWLRVPPVTVNLITIFQTALQQWFVRHTVFTLLLLAYVSLDQPLLGVCWWTGAEVPNCQPHEKWGEKHYPRICMATAILLKERNREMTGIHFFFKSTEGVCVCVWEREREEREREMRGKEGGRERVSQQKTWYCDGQRQTWNLLQFLTLFILTLVVTKSFTSCPLKPIFQLWTATLVSRVLCKYIKVLKLH